MAERLSRSLQESIVTLICTNDEQGKIAAGLVDVDLLEPPFDDVVARAIAYRKQYGKPPGVAHMDDLLDHVLSDSKHKRHKTYEMVLAGIMELSKGLNGPFILSRLNEFMRSQNLKAAIIEAGERMQAAPSGLVPDVERILHKALKLRQEPMDSGTFLNDRKRVLGFLSNPVTSYGLGIPELDRRNLGPTPGEMLAFMAPKGRGKCLTSDTLVLLGDGSLKRIEDVVRDRDKFIVAFDETTKSLKKCAVAAHIDSGIQSVFEIKTKMGYSIKCTDGHPFWTEQGWKQAGDICIGKDRIAIPWRLAGLGTKTEDKCMLRLLGYLLANGGLSKISCLTFTSHDSAIRRDFERCVVEYGDAVTWSIPTDCYVTSEPRWKKEGSYTLRLLRNLGLMEKKSSQKHIPPFIFNLKDEYILEFLDALFTCDLGIGQRNSIIEYCSSSVPMVKDVRHLLQRLGIVGRYSEFEAKLKGKKLPGYAVVRISTANNLLRFRDAFSLLGKKAEKLKRLPINVKQLQWQNPRPINDSVFFDVVTNIEPLGKAKTYDLSVPTYHSFVADGVIAHNTWFCVHTGVVGLLQGLKVCHITLEMKDDRIMPRYLQRLFAVAKRNEEFDVTKIEVDKKHKITGFFPEQRKPELFLTDPRIERKLGRLMDEWGERFGNLVVKTFPSGMLTLNQLEAYLDGLEASHKFVPNIIIIDYPDLMRIDDRQDHRVALGRLYVDLRGLFGTRNAAGIVPVQTNRKGESARLVTAELTGEDYSKTQTADIVLTYNQTGMERDLGLARLFVDKGRNDEDKFTLLISQAYQTGQFVLQSAYMNTSSYWKQIKLAAGVEDEDKGE